MQRQETTGKKEITVLDAKRSNAINIGLTVLPPPRTIKAAILKMDNAIMNREGIEVTTDKLFFMFCFCKQKFYWKTAFICQIISFKFLLWWLHVIDKGPDWFTIFIFFSPENFDWHDSHSRGENKHSGGPDG